MPIFRDFGIPNPQDPESSRLQTLNHWWLRILNLKDLISSPIKHAKVTSVMSKKNYQDTKEYLKIRKKNNWTQPKNKSKSKKILNHNTKV